MPSSTSWPARLRAALVTFALLAASLVAATTWGTSPAAAAGDTISGTVREAGGQPLAGVVIEAWVPSPSCSICDYGRIDTTETDALGRFTFDAASSGWDDGAALVLNPTADTFYLRTAYPTGKQPEDGELLPRGSSTQITLTATGGAVAGTISAPPEVYDTNIRVISVEPDESGYYRDRWDSYPIRPASGSYRTGAVPAGTYHLAFCETEYPRGGDDFSWCQGRILWWPGVLDEADATPITITNQQVTQPRDITITAPAYVSNTEDPMLSAPQVGKPVTVDPGTWTPSEVTFRYRWYLGESTISGATGRTYTPRAADLGKQLSVRVEGSKEGFQSSFGFSDPRKVAAGQLATKTKPRLSGTAKVGQKLTATAGTYSPRATSTYQWFANGKAIARATKATLSLTSALKGKTVTAKVTARATAYRPTVTTLSAGKVR